MLKGNQGMSWECPSVECFLIPISQQKHVSGLRLIYLGLNKEEGLTKGFVLWRVRFNSIMTQQISFQLISVGVSIFHILI